MTETQAVSSNLFGAKPSVRQACRMVLRYIHGRGLEPGDKLPSQTDLRQELRLGNDTLGEAMQVLVRCGILTRQRKIGTIIADPHQPALGLWSVALTLNDHHANGYYGMLEFFLRKFLTQRGCEDRTFNSAGPLPVDQPLELGHFPGLQEAVCAELVDVIVASEGMVAEEAPVFCLTATPHADWGQVLDVEFVLRQCVRHCQPDSGAAFRPALVHPKHPAYLTAFQADLDNRVFRELCPKCDGLDVITFEQPGLLGGQEAAEQILAMPPDDRPTGLMCLEGHAAMGLTESLAERPNYRPHILTLVPKQAPLLFRLPVLLFEVDLEQVAREAADRIMESLLNPDRPRDLAMYRPRVVLPGQPTRGAGGA